MCGIYGSNYLFTKLGNFVNLCFEDNWSICGLGLLFHKHNFEQSWILKLFTQTKIELNQKVIYFEWFY